MYTSQGHLTYCTNIHAGENWEEHFNNLKEHIPQVKEKISPLEPFGIGLRLSQIASVELIKEENLKAFQQWLAEHDCYVFTMNGFPYGGFHNTRVKDNVHAPDWLSQERIAYTVRLAKILTELLPDDLDGGISTSPLTYKFWNGEMNPVYIYEQATLHLMQAVGQLVDIKNTTGKLIHIDIEPEPDGLLCDGKEFLEWYVKYLLPIGIPFLEEKFGYIDDVAESVIKEHVQLCYDICHYAVGYEDHLSMIQHTRALGIKTGKIQISAALKADMPPEANKRTAVTEAFRKFNEPVYLHQVVARQIDGHLLRYPDMPEALADAANPSVEEWRAHYHVPLFIENYGLLQSTQKDIEEVLAIQKDQPFTTQLEVETYTWEVLPEEMRLPLTESITREMEWVIGVIRGTHLHTTNDQTHA
ncbi:MAG: metabolite traffic protein EboE [Chitinophagaceae bacterium]|nr:metabolite traffic protein EboE [Chitinophagaceae bacterium]